MKTVLIADDKDTGRELVRAAIEGSGYCVVEAIDGVEAVHLARECSPDLVILDLQMPRLDGFGVLAELRADPKLCRTPVLALTASAMPGDRGRAEKAGFDAYFSKPVRLSVLRGEVAKFLRDNGASS
jgi:CheY-like chemotaxis protein